MFHDSSSSSSQAVGRDVELHVAGGLVARQPQQQRLQRLQGQLAVREVEVLEAQGGGEELLEGRGDVALGLPGTERVPGQVQVGQVGGAAPDQGPEQQLAGHLGGREVEDGDDVGLGEEVDQAGHLLLQAVAGQIQVGERVQGELVGDQRLAQVVHPLASQGAVGQVDVPGKQEI